MKDVLINVPDMLMNELFPINKYCYRLNHFFFFSELLFITHLFIHKQAHSQELRKGVGF